MPTKSVGREVSIARCYFGCWCSENLMRHLILFLTLIVFLAGCYFQKQADQPFGDRTLKQLLPS
jgi:hypothetical protein